MVSPNCSLGMYATNRFHRPNITACRNMKKNFLRTGVHWFLKSRAYIVRRIKVWVRLVWNTFGRRQPQWNLRLLRKRRIDFFPCSPTIWYPKTYLRLARQSLPWGAPAFPWPSTTQVHGARLGDTESRDSVSPKTPGKEEKDKYSPISCCLWV